MYHTPVLLEESINGLKITPEGTYIDATFGGGGHSRLILEKLNGGRLLAFDCDTEAAKNTIDDDRFLLINANYRYIRNYLKLHDCIPCDGILADLGISSHQIDDAERGFSTRFDGELDMRMNGRGGISAADVVNNYSPQELIEVFRHYGEVRNSHVLVQAISAARISEVIRTTGQLKSIAVKCAPRHQENKYLAQVFQAIRIEVNQELDALVHLLEKGMEVLRPGGRMVIISYHSLEDRLVKNFFRSGNITGTAVKDFYGNTQTGQEVITRKPIVPNLSEIDLNPRARSAKLRIAEKKLP